MKWMGFISRSPSVLERKTLNTLRKSLSYIKENIKGVKEIMLMAAINTIQDQADDLNDEALKLQKENKFKEAAKFYRQVFQLSWNWSFQCFHLIDLEPCNNRKTYCLIQQSPEHILSEPSQLLHSGLFG
jgi:hypothetical protein